MMIWIVILILLILGLCAGLAYLVSRCYRLPYVRRWGGGSKKRKLGLAVLPVLALSLVLFVIWDWINTIICILHLMFFWLVCDGVNTLIQKKRKKKTNYYIVGGIVMVVTIGYLSAGYYLDAHVSRTHYTVETDKAVGDLRIVQFADSHVGTTFDGEEFSEYVERMQRENPDIVVITGDFVDDSTDRENMVSACRALRRLKPKYGTYFCFGNHDKGYFANDVRGYDGDDLIAELQKNGVIVLQDESVLLDNRFYVLGRQDRSEDMKGNPRAQMNDLMSGLESDKFCVVLDHQPYDYDAEEKSNADMVLSGHTHGGQMIPINFVGEWTGENAKRYGYEKRGNTNFIVTSGISDWAIKFKTGCQSEYVVIDVHTKEKK